MSRWRLISVGLPSTISPALLRTTEVSSPTKRTVISATRVVAVEGRVLQRQFAQADEGGLDGQALALRARAMTSAKLASTSSDRKGRMRSRSPFSKAIRIIS